MLRRPLKERFDWRELAEELGFKFHTLYGEAYWDETAYYQFSLKQIEEDLEAPTEEVHQLCLDAVQQVLNDDELLRKFAIPEAHWDFIKKSWDNGDPSLYSRLDLCYDGTSPAKLYENNADTPTSVYETGFWQWLWLEDRVNQRLLSYKSDQFNSLQEKLVSRFQDLAYITPGRYLHFACCKDSEEDRGTVQYLQDCAHEAGIKTKFIYMEDIGIADKAALLNNYSSPRQNDTNSLESSFFTDLEGQEINWLFKLYPWEFIFEEEYGKFILDKNIRFIEPPWKAILSNKALLPLLWKLHPGHPNLLPAFFEGELQSMTSDDPAQRNGLIKKPLFSREGANISLIQNQAEVMTTDGPYGAEGYIYQAYHPTPRFGQNHTLVGSWLVNDQAAGISIREDSQLITQDMSRFLPHIILD